MLELFNIIFIFYARHLHCMEHETTLTASHTNAYDQSIAISANTEHVDVNTSSNTWRLNPQSQQSYDLLLSLKNEWSFHPNVTSQITLEIDGNTPVISKEDGEFLIVFSAENHKYFSVVIRLDDHNSLWKYYPSKKVLATTNDVYNDIISGEDSLTSRWDRVSDGDNWSNIYPRYKGALQWPLTLKLINNPIANTLQYDCMVNDVVLHAEYNDSFPSNLTEIYIMNDADDGKPIDIYWIKVQYADDTMSDVEETTTSTTSISTTESDTEIPTTTVITSTSTTSFSSTTTLYSTTSTTASETETQLETEAATEAETDVTNTMDAPLKEFSSENHLATLETGIMVAIVIACVCFTIFIVVAFWGYSKREEEVNSPHSINKSEYHTPKLDLSNTDIENILEKKRKESVQYGSGFIVANGTKKKQAIIPIKSDESDESDEGREAEKFVRK